MEEELHWRIENILGEIRLFMDQKVRPPYYKQIPIEVKSQLIKTLEWMRCLFKDDLRLAAWVATGFDTRDLQWISHCLKEATWVFTWPSYMLLSRTRRHTNLYQHRIIQQDELKWFQDHLSGLGPSFDPIAREARRVVDTIGPRIELDEEMRHEVATAGIRALFTPRFRASLGSCSRPYGNETPDLWCGLITLTNELCLACIEGNYGQFYNLAFLIEATWKQVDYTGYGYAIQGMSHNNQILLARFTRHPL